MGALTFLFSLNRADWLAAGTGYAPLTTVGAGCAPVNHGGRVAGVARSD